MEGRYIGENIRLLLDIAEKAEEENLPGLLVSLDIEKAFDSVELPFLFKALASFGIPEECQQMIEVLYANSTSCVINNGYTTKYFSLERGVRQGDPLSPYLFILAIEVLAIAIRKNTEIKGMNINGNIFKLLQYADDTTVLLADKTSLLTLKNLLKRFGEVSGLIVNESKTVCTGLGPWKDFLGQLHGFSIAPNPLKILGIWFCHNKKQMQDLNVSGKFAKLKKTLNDWHTRGLTIQGKILILKTLGISQLTYAMINLPVSQKILAEIDKFCFSYLWGGPNKAKIKRNVMIQDYRNGGLKAPDIYIMNKSWKLSWIPRLQNDISGNWKQIILDSLTSVGGLDYLLACNFDAKKLPVTLSSFWYEVFQAYSEINNTEIKSKSMVRNQYINNNRDILIGGKSIFSNQLIINNMDEIGNWFDCNGNAYSFDFVKQKLPQLSWLRYFQIISAIPKKWKLLLKEKSKINQIDQITPMFSIKKAKAKLLQNQLVKPVAISKWQIQKSEIFWEKTFKLARKITMESKLQVFQFKILHRVLPTRELLAKQKVVNTPFCLNCTNEPETSEHLLFDCPSAKKIWETIRNIFQQKENFSVNLGINSCILGMCSSNEKIRKWNYIALILKFYLYKSSLNRTTPTVPVFCALLENKLQTTLLLTNSKEISKKQQNQWAVWLND